MVSDVQLLAFLFTSPIPYRVRHRSYDGPDPLGALWPEAASGRSVHQFLGNRLHLPGLPAAVELCVYAVARFRFDAFPQSPFDGPSFRWRLLRSEPDEEVLFESKPAQPRLMPVDWEAAFRGDQSGVGIGTLRSSGSVTFRREGLYYAEPELDGVLGPRLPLFVHLVPA